MKPGSRPRGGRKGKSAARDVKYDITQLDRLAAKSSTFLRRMGMTPGYISTSAGGVLTAGQLASTGNVNSAPDFSSCTALYQVYRVRALEVQVLPFYPVETTSVVVPALIAVCPYQNGAPPTSLQGMVDSTGSIMCSGYRGYKFAADFRRDPNAHLWTPVTSGIATTSQFGIAYCGQTAPTVTVSVPVWAVVSWAVVEFQAAS